MADVLELVGLPKLSSSTKSGGKHVEFVSVDKCKVQNWPSSTVLSLFFKWFLMFDGWISALTIFS